jgi:SAM-dependent methyltransferase
VFFTDLVELFHLDGTGRLLDLGCGTGQLTLRLAEHVAAATGIDPEPEMLNGAARQAQAAGVGDVTWAQGSSADLPGELGHFDLVTMGRSFHWMDREQVLTALDGMVDNDGGLVIANNSCLIRSATAWQQAIEDVQLRFLPPDWQAGIPTAADGHEASRGNTGALCFPTRATADLPIHPDLDDRAGNRLPLLDLDTPSSTTRRQAGSIRTRSHRHIARNRPGGTIHRTRDPGSADGQQAIAGSLATQSIRGLCALRRVRDP